MSGLLEIEGTRGDGILLQKTFNRVNFWNVGKNVAAKLF